MSSFLCVVGMLAFDLEGGWKKHVLHNHGGRLHKLASNACNCGEELWIVKPTCYGSKPAKERITR